MKSWFTGKKSEDAAARRSLQGPAELLLALRDTPTSLVLTFGERGSGKSMLANIITRSPMFPLEARGYGLQFCQSPINWQQIAEVYGLKAVKEGPTGIVGTGSVARVGAQMVGGRPRCGVGGVDVDQMPQQSLNTNSAQRSLRIGVLRVRH